MFEIQFTSLQHACNLTIESFAWLNRYQVFDILQFNICLEITRYR